jgi:hypothetical protein
LSAWSGASFDNANTGDPVAGSAPKPGFHVFAFEVGARAAQFTLIDILQYVYIDDSIEMIRDLAGNEGHGAAARADVKQGRSRSKGVL